MAGSPGPGAALDAAALELLEALETLQQRRHLLTQLLRQGWLSLSQARYSLGCHRVSSLQYGATMVPRVRVLPRQDPGGPPRFEEVPGTGGDPEDPGPQQGGGDGLRQRRGPPGKGGASPRAPPDPLAWFGVLVPPSLRQAQGSFIQGVAVAVELAGLQGAVAAAAARYRALLRRKRHPDGDSGDTQTPGDTNTPGDTQTPGDTETPGDTNTLGDTETSGDTETHEDTETLGDTETLEDTKTTGDTESSGDTNTLGDTKTPGDTETSGDTEDHGDIKTTEAGGDTEDHGDTETTSDTGTPADTETAGDTETPGDTETLGDTETAGDTKTPGDTETAGDVVTSGDTGTV